MTVILKWYMVKIRRELRIKFRVFVKFFRPAKAGLCGFSRGNPVMEIIMKESQGKKITITHNGPYEVSGGVPLDRASIAEDKSGASESWKRSRADKPEEDPYYLCRCGHSHNKPFCDGNHEAKAFRGREKPDRSTYAERAQVQMGEAVNLLDDDSLCVGARFCDRGGTVWGLVEESGNPANLKMAVEEACNCPAGRLTIVDSENRMLEPELPMGISLVEDPAKDCRGPLWVQGGIQIKGANGETYEVRNRVTLCRCGETRNGPYCDGSHYDCPTMKGLDK